MGQCVVVSGDLLFASQITSAARAADVAVQTSRTVDALQGLLDAGGVSLVIVDMDLPIDVATGAIRASAGHSTSPQTIAFYSHVRTDLRIAAETAGAAQILPRSKMGQAVPQLMAQYR